MKHDDSDNNRSKQSHSSEDSCCCGHHHADHDHCHCEDELLDRDKSEDECDGDDDARADFEVDMALMREIANTKNEMCQDLEQLKKELQSHHDQKLLAKLVEKTAEYSFLLGMCEETQEQQAAFQYVVDRFREFKPEELPISLRRLLVDVLCEKGSIYLEQEEYDNALQSYQESLKEAESLAAEGDEMGRIDFGGILLNECAVYTQQEQYDKAESLVLQAIEWLETVVGQEFSDSELARRAYATLGDALMVRSQQLFDQEEADLEKVVGAAEKALGIFRKLRDEGSTDFLDKLGSALLYLYDIDSEDHSRQESIDMLNEAIIAMEQIADREEFEVAEDLENARYELDRLQNEDNNE